MKVLVTGASGFLGLNIVESLIENGDEVHVYVRQSSNIKYLKPFEVTVHVGELNNDKSLETAMQGMDGVIHTAGNTSCFNRDFNLLYDVNVNGTKSVVNAAIKSGVKRLVYTSTTSTIGGCNSKINIADESCKLVGFRARSPYAKTKQLAEQIVAQANSRNFEVVILNPAEVIGAYDYHFQWGRMVMAICSDQVPFIPPGGASFCSAKEVGRAHVSALTKGNPGERYILADVNEEYNSFLEAIESHFKMHFKRPKVNYNRFYWKERLREKVYPFLGRDFMVEPYRLRVFGGHYYFSSKKSQQNLGYRPASLQRMISDCVGWYQSQGFLPS